MTMQDHEANIGEEGKEFSSTVVFLPFFDVNKMSDQSLTFLSPIGSLAEYSLKLIKFLMKH